MKKYFLVEEYTTYQKNIYIPFQLTGYGKYGWEEFWQTQKNVDYSPFRYVIVRTLDNNRDYNQYIKTMQYYGAIINYN